MPHKLHGRHRNNPNTVKNAKQD